MLRVRRRGVKAADCEGRRWKGKEETKKNGREKCCLVDVSLTYTVVEPA